jgi:hypothetical protein
VHALVSLGNRQVTDLSPQICLAKGTVLRDVTLNRTTFFFKRIAKWLSRNSDADEIKGGVLA